LACDNDCDDNDASVSGDLPEDCSDGIDNDCDEIVDCDDPDCETSCFEVVCDDGIDGDADGLMDCDDPDCVAEDVCLEIICDDGIDEDGDGLMDCDDPDCSADTYCETECVDTTTNDLGGATGTAIATGTNAGEGDDFTGSCTQGLYGEDVVYLWTAPEAGTYSFSTAASDYDTVLYVIENCVGSELDCNDDVDFASGDTTSEITDLFIGEGESILVVIDSYEVFETGTYYLDITPTFEPDCSDGLDNDGDGDIDCSDSDCDYDAACASATCPNWDLGTSIGNGIMSGDLTGATVSHFQASCSAQGASDYVVAWEASDSGCATVDTLSGTMDTILALFDDCPSNGGTELACNDDSSSTVFESELSYDVTAGTVYYIGLDAWTYDIAATYVLDVNVAVGTSCN
jgi:hypothetical protein